MVNKRLWKSIAVSTILALALTACGGTASNEAPNNANGEQPAASTGEDGTTSDAPKEERKLRVMFGVVGGKTPEETEQFEKEIERLTGIQIEIEKPASDYNQKLTAAISGGEQYDIVQLSQPQMNEFAAQGALTDLTEFAGSAGNLSDPSVIPADEWNQLRDADGKLYGVFSKFQGGTMPIVRADWLRKLKLEEPKTLDDFYNVLKAFKEQDPDGNSQADTYGLSTAGMYEIQGFMSAAGLKQRYVMEGGKRTIPYATEAAIPVYEFFAKLYEEGILDPNFATNDTAKMRNLFLSDRVGMVTYWDAWVGLFNNMKREENPNTEFEAKGILGAEGPDGKVILRRGEPDVFAIPVNAKHPQTAMEFIDWWHSHDAIRLGSIGIKDHDWVEKDGKIELTDAGKEHGMDHGVPFWYNETYDSPFPKLPGVEAAQQIVKEHATLELTLPEWSDAEKIVNNYAFKAIMGEMSAADAVAKMNEELKAANLID